MLHVEAGNLELQSLDRASLIFFSVVVCRALQGAQEGSIFVWTIVDQERNVPGRFST